MKQVNIDNVWNQAYSLFRSGLRYWFNDQEIQELNRENTDFQVVSIEEQMLLQYFERPRERGRATHDRPHRGLGVLLEDDKEPRHA